MLEKLGLGCIVMLFMFLIWIYALRDISRAMISHLTRPYDPSKDHKNPLRR